MAERLPFGEIRPAARPINSFIQPGQGNVAEAGRPALLGRPSGVDAIQTASSGNVQGYNQYAQLADALSPFNRQLGQLMETGAIAYATGKIEQGYYDELKNQVVRSKLNLQMQQEQGAANAASMVGQLEKVDPPAAQLLRESNPWVLIGRRRALAQMAGAEIDNVLMADLDRNQGMLSGLQPGSGALLQRKAELSQQVLGRYGLTGEEPEAAFYMTPKLNQAWDKYSEKQRALYGEQLRINGTAAATAGVGQLLQSLAENGIPYQGRVIKTSDPEFPQLAGLAVTMELDKTLSMFGGKDRADALKEIRTQLVGTFGQVPVLSAALSFVQGGNPGDNNRPTWGASNPLDMLELQNRGSSAKLQNYENGQKIIQSDLDKLWWGEGMPGQLLPSDPAYAAALQNFRQRAAAAGLYDIDGYLKGKLDAQESVATRAFAPDPLASEDFLTQIGDLPRSAFSTPQGIEALRQQAKDAARSEPTVELQRQRYAEYLQAIEKRKQQAADTTPGLQQAIDKALLQDLGLPQVKPLVDAAKSKGGGDAFTAALQGGAGAMAAASGLGSDKITAFTQRLNNLFLRNAEAKIDAWVAEHPGVPLTSSVRNVLISGAIAETRKSKEYEQAFTSLTGKKPGEVGQGTGNGTAPGPEVRGVPRSAARSLPDSTVKGFAVRPVMNGDWLYGELQAVSQGKPVSAELYGMASRAGTTTNRYLLEQLRFYPQLDPKGEARRYLEEKIRGQRQGQTVSQANWQGVSQGTRMGMVPVGYNPLAPGSWLMNMLMPPAAAITLPTGAAAGMGGGGGGGGYRGTPPVGARNALVSVAQQLGIRPVDLAAVISMETGGSFDKDIQGGQGGKYRGLIQFGPTEQKTYGYRPGMTFEEQLAGPVFRYLRDRGVRPGHGVQEIYAAILTGNVANIKQGGLDWKDSFGTSVRGALPGLTRGGHYKNALRFLGS